MTLSCHRQADQLPDSFQRRCGREGGSYVPRRDRAPPRSLLSDESRTDLDPAGIAFVDVDPAGRYRTTPVRFALLLCAFLVNSKPLHVLDFEFTCLLDRRRWQPSTRDLITVLAPPGVLRRVRFFHRWTSGAHRVQHADADELAPHASAHGVVQRDLVRQLRRDRSRVSQPGLAACIDQVDVTVLAQGPQPRATPADVQRRGLVDEQLPGTQLLCVKLGEPSVERRLARERLPRRSPQLARGADQEIRHLVLHGDPCSLQVLADPHGDAEPQQRVLGLPPVVLERSPA